MHRGIRRRTAGGVLYPALLRPERTQLCGLSGGAPGGVGALGQCDSAVVHPDWRGNGLQRKLLEAALPLVRPGIVGIGATVSPENQYSLNNALACGFVIADRREMYGGYDRYLLKKML